MALVLTHIILCLRISECLKLRAEDSSFKASTVYIGPLKRQEAMRKPILPEIKAMLLLSLLSRKERPIGEPRTKAREVR